MGFLYYYTLVIKQRLAIITPPAGLVKTSKHPSTPSLSLIRRFITIIYLVWVSRFFSSWVRASRAFGLSFFPGRDRVPSHNDYRLIRYDFSALEGWNARLCRPLLVRNNIFTGICWCAFGHYILNIYTTVVPSLYIESLLAHAEPTFKYLCPILLSKKAKQ